MNLRAYRSGSKKYLGVKGTQLLREYILTLLPPILDVCWLLILCTKAMVSPVAKLNINPMFPKYTDRQESSLSPLESGFPHPAGLADPEASPETCPVGVGCPQRSPHFRPHPHFRTLAGKFRGKQAWLKRRPYSDFAMASRTSSASECVFSRIITSPRATIPDVVLNFFNAKTLTQVVVTSCAKPVSLAKMIPS
ncbi:hypothetical protein MAR_035778 [Mya arenaria]|uniref:Uncharacterized protein n=1 Tax=Mya arenaria TaxID=6604 RepID=A0ABY7EL40_MYAAR|nr:hypothetical protein MAR_035778 [Mya arenaria]